MGDAEFSGRELRFEVGPFGMKTFRVKLARPARALTPAAEAAVELPYNVKTASYNPFRSDANFDGKGCSYAAELLPSCIMYGGVGFEMGDPAAENGVKCRRDTIDLPRGRYGKLYLLAASTMYDTQAVFTVDGKEHTALVPYYGGFIGQWGHTGHTEPYLKDAQVAFVGTHKHDMIRNEDRPYEFTYMFRIGLDIPEGARQLVLPDDPRIVVFAATVAEDPAGGIGAACDLLRVQLPVKGADASQAGRRNLLGGGQRLREGRVRHRRGRIHQVVRLQRCQTQVAGGGSRTGDHDPGLVCHARCARSPGLHHKGVLPAGAPEPRRRVENGGHGLRQHGP